MPITQPLTSDLTGKLTASLDGSPDQLLTVGMDTVAEVDIWGFNTILPIIGSLTPQTTTWIYSGVPTLVTIDLINWTDLNNFLIKVGTGGNGTNAGWEIITVNGTSFSRSAATFTGGDQWRFGSTTINPMGFVIGATRNINWTLG